MSQGPGDKEYEEFSLPLQQMEQYAPEHYSDRLTRGTQGKINKVRYVILSETPEKIFLIKNDTNDKEYGHTSILPEEERQKFASQRRQRFEAGEGYTASSEDYVLLAGYIHFNENGVAVGIDNHSGHYRMSNTDFRRIINDVIGGVENIGESVEINTISTSLEEARKMDYEDMTDLQHQQIVSAAMDASSSYGRTRQPATPEPETEPEPWDENFGGGGGGGRHLYALQSRHRATKKISRRRHKYKKSLRRRRKSQKKPTKKRKRRRRR